MKSFSEKKEAVMDPVFWWPLGFGVYLAIGLLIYMGIVVLDTFVAGTILPKEEMRQTRMNALWIIPGWLLMLLLLAVESLVALIAFIALQVGDRWLHRHKDSSQATAPSPAPPPQ